MNQAQREVLQETGVREADLEPVAVNDQRAAGWSETDEYLVGEFDSLPDAQRSLYYMGKERSEVVAFFRGVCVVRK